LGSWCHCARKRHSLLLPARKFVDAPPFESTHADEFKTFGNASIPT
jgi:hypothetical protein